MTNAYEKIYEHLCGLEVIDTHEHLPLFEDQRDKNTDVLKEYLTHYFSRDLVSAGLTLKDLARVNERMDDDIETKWSLVAPYWEAARHTGYGRSLDIAVKTLYQLDRISGETIGELNRKFLETLSPGWFRKVLKDICNIKTVLLNDGLEKVDPAYFTRVTSPPLFPQHIDDLRTTGEFAGVKIISMEDWKIAMRKLIEKIFAQGTAALKFGFAYERSLSVEDVPTHRAEEEWNALFGGELLAGRDVRTTPSKALQDHLIHNILRVADDMEIPVQIHTGIQEGSGNFLANSDPILLNNLFLQYSNVKFDIFHIGYPFQHKLSSLAKNFANVNIDMCWAHIISPEASVRALVEFLDAVPANKISAFGGDYCFVDGVVGHLELARQNVARALAEKVRLDIFDLDRACEIAKMLFFDNPARIFGIE